jgi:hypothetical protein
MQKKRPIEQELLKDLEAFGGHADELGELLPQESEPLERLKGSGKKFERPVNIPVSVAPLIRVFRPLVFRQVFPWRQVFQ